ncbi:MAG: Mov34/MPN/PAD-1 family protein [Deltaproteobacteria bacterium]|nr:Mov34/MPN/PAD-1 family protein [Deltaproteobacteria bacterium]
MRAEPEAGRGPAAGAPVPAPLLRAVFAHAAAAYPRECCGLLLGPRHGALDEVRQCANAQDRYHEADAGTFPRDARSAFTLGVDDIRALAASLDGPRPARVLYHSHVDAPARFSAEDERLALLGGEAPAWPLLHLVVEVRAGVALGAALHEWDPARRRFREAGRFTGTVQDWTACSTGAAQD